MAAGTGGLMAVAVVSVEFAWGHRLHGLERGHKCGRIHGHNLTLTVEFSTLGLEDTGWVADFAQLRKLVQTHVVDDADHRLFLHPNDPLCGVLMENGEEFKPLYLGPGLAGTPVNPTSENMARWVRERLELPLHQLNAGTDDPRLRVKIERVTVQEGSKSMAYVVVA